ncbi:myeloid-associated differentiation marker-like protein 2 [Megalops cyprinoides]|uniref:myeloid-associated differentiation marker-like protein 2 n=1 Tax=Megalops cyprinoides TaxID=118141 RepID=UPI001863FB54|nr:myeloid-associated differentiation marker-like protein 2 [Megalops cyprinoides]
MDQIAFTPSSLISSRGILHMIEIVLSALDAGLLNLNYHPSHTYWVWCMFTWVFCTLMTLIITVIELFKIDLLLTFFRIMDWDDFAVGMAMTMTLMVFSTAVIYPVFYACSRCYLSWVISVISWLILIAYAIEAVKGKMSKKGSYLSILPGFIKVLEAFVTCIIFISLTGYVGKPGLYWCILVYIIPFPVTLLVIVINVLQLLKKCIPFDLNKYMFFLLLVFVLLYVTAAIIWPIYSFRGNPRPADCPPNFCIWSILFVVTFMTYVNLILYIVDCIFTKLKICGF